MENPLNTPPGPEESDDAAQTGGRSSIPVSDLSAQGVVLRGALMGLAEVVPGVSGGTMAFITGIYHELVSSLAKFGPRSLTLLNQPLAFYTFHNLRFLLLLGVGMVLGVVLFAQLMHFLLASYQTLVFGALCWPCLVMDTPCGWRAELHKAIFWWHGGSFGLVVTCRFR